MMGGNGKTYRKINSKISVKLLDIQPSRYLSPAPMLFITNASIRRAIKYLFTKEKAKGIVLKNTPPKIMHVTSQ